VLSRRTAVPLILVLLLPVGVLSCDSESLFSSREALLVEAGFRTDADSYRQVIAAGQPVATIRAVLENRFGRALVPVPCTYDAPEWTLERRQGERWEVAANASCLLVGWAPTVISSGAEYRVMVELTSHLQPGTYRLVFGLHESNADGPVPVLDGRARSNTFTLTD